MFNNTEHNVKATADDPSGAVAHLLTNRRGIWFTFDLDMMKTKGRQAVHTSLITSFSETQIRTADGCHYRINKDTYNKLLEIMTELEGLENGPIQSDSQT